MGLAKTLGKSVREACQLGASEPLRAAEAETLRQLYLHMMERDPASVFEALAVPLKEELLRSEDGAELLLGDQQETSIAVQGRVVPMEKDAFSLGRIAPSDVLVGADRCVSRMQCWL